MNLKRAAGLSLMVISGILSWSNFIFTGAVVGVSSSLSWMVVIMFIVGIFLTFLAKEGLEQRLFYKDSTGVIRINDFKGELLGEGIQPREEASKTLSHLKRKFGNPDLKDTFVSVFSDYIDMARKQRDSSEEYPIPSGSEIEMADRFLKDWDPNYSPVINHLLREREYNNYLPDAGVFDTREVVKIMQENIPGFIAINMTAHDVRGSYNKSRVQDLCGGTLHPYETDSNAINRVLQSIAERDVLAKRIKESELRKRIDILKKAVYGN